MRSGYMMVEWLVAICLTALLMTGIAPLIGGSIRACGDMFARLYCARESMQIAGILDSYLEDATVTESRGNRQSVAFQKANELPQRWMAGSQQLYLVLSDGQRQPVTVPGKGTATSPSWQAGEGGQAMFTVSEGGFVTYAYAWQYGGRALTVRGGICPLPTAYSVGNAYVYR